ncbi:MAG TPA: helix-turn-helix transcriptional regulator [Solirubrobacteraceae bacterium]|nr:helix-turn-helix transcriptional regulator [Solirubrobacteraceae bacterium]
MPTPTDTTAARQSDRQLLTAWLLLLVEDEGYGWALRRRLEEHGVRVDPAAVYRRLRHLERAGLLVSHWTKSDAGPQRRLYRTTPKAQAALDEAAAAIRDIRDVHAAFQRAYEDSKERASSRDPGANGWVTAGEPAAGSTGGRPTAAVRLERELLAAWLLLLLDGGASYGYGLRRRLERHGIDVEPAGMYRALRQLERDGWLESRWLAPADGPARHFYRLTRRGRRNLDEVARMITRIHDTHDAFVRAYEQSRAQRWPVDARQAG